LKTEDAAVSLPTRPAPALSKAQKIAWGMGAITDHFMTNSVANIADKIYTMGFGVNPSVLGWVMALPRLIDAFADPLMGALSDNTRSRFGRRRPYIAAGAVLSGLLFVLMWSPPAWLGQTGLAIFLLITAILYYLAYTVFTVPWSAFGLELTDDYHERTQVQAYRIFLAALGGIALGFMWKLAFYFGDGDDKQGIHKTSLLFGIVIVVSGLIPLFCREKIRVQQQPKIPVKQAFVQTFRNRPFVLLMTVVFLILMGLFLVQRFGGYINVYYVFGGNKEAVSTLDIWSNLIFQTSGIVLIPAISFLSRKLGKKNTMLLAEAAVGLAFLTSWVLYNPAVPYLQLIFFFLIAPGLSCVWMLSSSMIADICDVDEQATGLRREGAYGAAFSFMCKASVSTTLIISGYLLNLCGYNAAAAMPSPESIYRLRIMYMVIPTCFFALAFGLTLLYPLSEKRIRAIRAELDQRQRAE
jgi:GPH family glycoside/pentoside/hexuronide:cation symporter